MKFRIIAAALAFALGSNIAHAAPTLIAYGDINQATLEDFEDSSIPTLPDPKYTFDGFQYSGTRPLVANVSNCPNVDQCLQDNVVGVRKFDALNEGTVAIGFAIGKIQENNNLTATVVGTSSSMTFSNIGSGLIGFLDPDGLISVSFDNLGTLNQKGNYLFDNVKTGTTVVPLPAGLPLLAGGLLALGLLRRRASGSASA